MRTLIGSFTCAYMIHVLLSVLVLVLYVPCTDALADSDSAIQQPGDVKPHDEDLEHTRVVHDLVVQGNLVVMGRLKVIGHTEVAGAFKSVGNMNLNGDLAVGGSLKSSADIKAAGDLYAQGSVHVSGAVNTRGDMNVDGQTEVGGGMRTAGGVHAGGSLTAGGSMGVKGDVGAGGGISAGGDVHAGHNITAGGDVKVERYMFVSRDLYVAKDMYIKGKIHRHWAEELGTDHIEDVRRFCESVTPGSLQVADCMSDILAKKPSEDPNPLKLLPSRREMKHVSSLGAEYYERISAAFKSALLMVHKNLASSLASFVLGTIHGERPLPDEASAVSNSDEAASDEVTDPEDLLEGDSTVQEGGIPVDLQPCQKDLGKLCESSMKWVPESADEGEVYEIKLECLIMSKPAISEPSCAEAVFQAQLAAALDYRKSPDLLAECKEGAEGLCDGVEHGVGRVNACLQDHRAELNFGCAASLFRQEVMAAGDVRLQVHAADACEVELSTFCSGVRPDNDEALLCLENYRYSDGFSADCKDEIETLMEAQSQDYRLDATLRRVCEREIHEACAYEVNAQTEVQSTGSVVVECLQDFVMYGGENKDDSDSTDRASHSCAEAVTRTLSRKSEDIRFSGHMAQACKQDQETFCNDVTPGQARVLKCLDYHSETLTKECTVALFDHRTRMSESLAFNKPLRNACASEVQRYCARVPTRANTNIGNGSYHIQCLQEHRSRKSFSNKCKEELQSVEAGLLTDRHLNVHLYSTCAQDAMSLWGTNACMRVQQDLGAGAGSIMLQCLISEKDQIQDADCKQEVEYRAELQDWSALDD